MFAFDDRAVVLQPEVNVLAGPDARRVTHGVLGDGVEATRLLYLERHSLAPLRSVALPENVRASATSLPVSDVLPLARAKRGKRSGFPFSQDKTTWPNAWMVDRPS